MSDVVSLRSDIFTSSTRAVNMSNKYNSEVYEKVTHISHNFFLFVSEHVSLHFGIFAGSVRAVRARVRLLPGVNPNVALKVRGVTGLIRALGAGEGLILIDVTAAVVGEN